MNGIVLNNRPGRNDPCHCGSGKKYKKCHLSTDETPSVPPRRLIADSDLVSISNRILDALDDVSSSVEMQRTYDTFFPQACAYHFAFLLHSVTRASTVLAQASCGSQLFALRRVAFEYWLWDHYYARHPDEACLYVASVPFEQERVAKRWALLDKSRDFTRQLREYKEQIKKLKNHYPRLEEFYSTNPTEPIYCITCRRKISKRKKERVDLMSLARIVFRALIGEHPEFVPTARQRYKMDPNLTDEQVADTFAEIQYLMNAKYPSQQLHGAALSLTPNLQSTEPGTFKRFADNFDDPNPLLWGILHFCVDAIEIIGKVNSIDVRHIVEPLTTEYNRVGDKLHIE